MSDEQSYKQGFIDGITAYAWYKDGVQHVGTTGKTFHEAVAHVEKTWNYNPPASPQGAQEVVVRRSEIQRKPPKIYVEPVQGAQGQVAAPDASGTETPEADFVDCPIHGKMEGTICPRC